MNTDKKFFIVQDIETANDLLSHGFNPIAIRDHAWYFAVSGDQNVLFDNFDTSKMAFTNILPM